MKTESSFFSGKTDKQKLRIFKVWSMVFLIYMDYGIITMIKLINTSQSYPFGGRGENTQDNSINTFQMYNVLLLTTGTTLYVRPLELILILTGSLYPLTNLPLPPPNHHSSLCCYEFNCFLDSTYKWVHAVFVFLCLSFLTEHNVLRVHACDCKW